MTVAFLSGWSYRKEIVVDQTDTLSVGPTKTTDGDYSVWKYAGSGYFSPGAAGNVEVLVVAGGGGGSSGGAGAGGYKADAALAVTATTYAITVGAGGLGKGYTTAKGLNGENSSIGALLVATGGGAGGYNNNHPTGEGNVGGSGGGGGAAADTNHGQAGTGTEGYAGSDNVNSSPTYPSGAGGGSGGAASGRTGGIGTANDITGSSVTYAAGGAGVLYNAGTAGVAGGANTGNGGAGASTGSGGNGGSGVVIIRFLTSSFPNAKSGTINYQMKLLVGESSGATGEEVDCNEKCLSTFNDLRFTSWDGETLLDYWIESISGTTPNQLATVWIEIPLLDDAADTTIYMYYGKTGASAVSSGANTFRFFDDFPGDALDTAKWDNINTATVSVASSIVSVTSSNNTWRSIQTDLDFARPARLRCLGTIPQKYHNYIGFSTLADPSSEGANAFFGGGVNIGVFFVGNGVNFEQPTFTPTGSQAIYEVQWSAALAKLYVGGSLKQTCTTYVPADAQPASIGANLSEAGAIALADWIFVANFTVNEPTWKSFGDIEWMPSGSDGLSLGDAAVIAIRRSRTVTRTKYRVEVHDGSGNLKWVIRDITKGSLDKSCNNPAVVSVLCPLTAHVEQMLSDLTKPNELWIWRDSELLFVGPIHLVELKHSGGAIQVQVDAMDYLQALKGELVETYDADDTIENHVIGFLADQVSGRPVYLGTIEPIVSRDITIEQDYIYTALMHLRDTVGGYLQVDPYRKLHWYNQLAASTGQQIRYRKNLMGITKTTDWLNFGNRLYIYGTDGTTLVDAGYATTYIEDATSIAKYNCCVRKFIEPLASIAKPEILIDYATNKLKEMCAPKISYTIDLLNLADYGQVLEELSLGSWVRLIDEEIDCDVDVQIVRLVLDLVRGQNIAVELSTSPSSIVDFEIGSYY